MGSPTPLACLVILPTSLCPCGESARCPASSIFSCIPGQGALSVGCAPLGPLPLHPPWVPSPCSSRSCCKFAELSPVCGFLTHANRHSQILHLRSVCQWELSPSFYVGEPEAQPGMLIGLGSHSRSAELAPDTQPGAPLAVSLDSQLQGATHLVRSLARCWAPSRSSAQTLRLLGKGTWLTSITGQPKPGSLALEVAGTRPETGAFLALSPATLSVLLGDLTCLERLLTPVPSTHHLGGPGCQVGAAFDPGKAWPQSV